MATVKIKNLKNVSKAVSAKINIAINKMLRNKVVRLKVGEIVVADIRKNFKGRGAADSTIDWRDFYDIYNEPLDPAYEKLRAKGIYTGELLRDLETNVKAITTDKAFLIEHSKKLHKKYQGKNGKIGNRIAYDELSRILVEDLRINYLVLSDKAKSTIIDLIRKEIARALS